METRTGRRTAVVTVFAVLVIAGALIWLGRDHIRFFIAFESFGRIPPWHDVELESRAHPLVTVFRRRKSRMW